MSDRDSLRPYRRRPDEGEALWFLGTLATVKAGGAETHGRLAVVEIVHPVGFAPPLHRHLEEDEAFFVLSGTARFSGDGEEFDAGPGDFVMLPVGLPHSFVVGPDEPLRALQITTPGGFEDFAAEVGETAARRELPPPGLIDPARLGHAASRHHIEILGPPPGR